MELKTPKKGFWLKYTIFIFLMNESQNKHDSFPGD